MQTTVPTGTLERNEAATGRGYHLSLHVQELPDHDGPIRMITMGEMRTRQLDVTAAERSSPEPQMKYGTTAFEAQKAFVEVDTSGTCGGKDQVAETKDDGRDHFVLPGPRSQRTCSCLRASAARSIAADGARSGPPATVLTKIQERSAR